MTERYENAGFVGQQGSRRSLNTPALVIDKAALERNIKRMADFAAGHGLALRPHASFARRRVRKIVSSAYVADDVRKGSRVRIRRSMVESSVVIENDVHLHDTLVLPGVRIGRGSREASGQ